MAEGVGFVVPVVVVVKSTRRVARLSVPPAQFDLIIIFSYRAYVCPEPISILVLPSTDPLPIHYNPSQSAAIPPGPGLDNLE